MTWADISKGYRALRVRILRLLGGLAKKGEDLDMDRIPLADANGFDHRFEELLAREIGLSGQAIPPELGERFLTEFRAWLEALPDQCHRKPWGSLQKNGDSIAIYPNQQS